ncbi:anti-sigma factor [Pararhizobium antarcticum]|uniref:Anti-sigma factor n=1 Tax=Pararhizobium antarcticum TaxID=1798805 RepID=A0A657LLK0_9HYPH|nr:anti-sigma factor [Pararhizobium antarcticum]OJF90477.1 anti-sigma factor [Pararhizobium antarcticum]OJF98553.1 anti-sigma factor [Rhizobium sp. 58]
MTPQKPESGDFRRDEVIAGEYVLGVLSVDDRRRVEARMVLDRSFAAMVGRWQDNLSSFEDEVEPIAPPTRVLSTIERRLFAEAVQGTPAGAASGGFWNSLALWRGLTLAAVIGMAGLGTINSALLSDPKIASPLVAELSGDGSASMNLFAQYDGENGTLRVTPVAARQTEEKSLELWLIVGDTPPQSLGVLPQTGNGEIVIAPELRAKIGEGTTLAVSVEPFGGSPTGSATGPVIAAGKARNR